MLTATVPPSGETLHDLMDAGLDLPCRTNNPDLWFADAPAELETAKAFCVSCPVAAECLAGALARHEPWGVWGGEIFERGAVIARKRPRGRPRKDAAPVVPAAPAASTVRGAANQEAAA
jgi:WhiB family redox-sensing transcriptional regulator